MEQKNKTTGNQNNRAGNFSRGPRPARRPGQGRRFVEREKPEFDHKVINVRRVARVVAGGRRFSFSVALVIGDKKGRVGVGIGKAGDTALAIEKATNQAKRNMIKISLTKNQSIPYEVSAKNKSAQIMLRPATGHGLIAGSAVRVVLHLAGLRDINAKVLSRSKDKLNIARATISALSKFKVNSAKKKEEEAVTPKAEV